MNILIIHNNYSTHGGEEGVVKMQKELFTAHGHNVHCYTRSHSEIKEWRFGKVKSLFTSLKNRSAIDDIEHLVKSNNIEVAYIHNLYPIISPAVIPALKKLRVKTILFAHNYRLICPTGLFFRDGGICEQCGSRGRELNCTFNRCEGSILGSMAYTIRGMNARLRGYFKDIDIIVALTEFQKQKLIDFGIEQTKIAVIPNFSTWKPITADNELRSDRVLFVGRLSKEKGYDVLFRAAELLPHVEFIVVGSTPSSENVEPAPKNITLAGHKEQKELQKLYFNSGILAITSRCYEAFPLTILEAGVSLLPIIAPNHGAITSIIEDGCNGTLFEPNDSADLAQKIEFLLSNREMRGMLAVNNYTKTLAEYSPQEYYCSIIKLLSL